MPNFTRRTAMAVTAAAPLAALSTRAQAASHQVMIQNFAFVPENLTVAAGDTITWINMDGAPHTATGDGGTFDTGRLNRGESASITVSSAGQLSYFCTFHRRMRGTVTIT